MRVLAVICLLLACLTSPSLAASATRHSRRYVASQAAPFSSASPSATKHNGWANSLKKPDASSSPSSNLDDDSPVYIWPMPASVQRGSVSRDLAHDFAFKAEPEFPDLHEAIDRYRRQIFTHRASGSPSKSALKSLTISVNKPKSPLQMETDESYTLMIDDTKTEAIIKAETFFGALHALETFSQIVNFNFTSGAFMIGSLPLTIDDKPRFPHRGVLLDTSRHYHPIASIKPFIDSMTMAKFNVFHWHLSDIQSFPYHSPALPRLSMAAYSASDKYSIYDVAEVVEYARARGVRVMIEFDVPGHAQSWCLGYPEVCPAPTCQMPVDPSTNATFNLMQTLFTEMTGGKHRAGLFPEDLFHLGGDEVDLSCWTTVDHVQQWLTANNFTSKDAYRYVVERAHDLIYSYGRIPVNWDEVYDNFGKTIDPQTIIHVWRDESIVAAATNDGFRVLVSPDGPWYLDGMETLWSDMYNLEPFAGVTNTTQQSLILGGEACMWSEEVDTSDLMATVWPRAGAVAERLWSPISVNNATQAEPRLANFRCLLNQRGIGAAPLLNSLARQPPNGPGACLSQ